MISPDTDTPPRYRAIARIGRGGMAEVLLAAAQSSGVTKLFVLKCLWPELVEDPDFVEMFVDEARLCARLHHPNVVQTYEVLSHDGRLAMAMEYVDGQTLTSVLSRLGGPHELSLPLRLRIVRGVLAGLDYAHGLADFDGTPLAVVHRDVSPNNVMVTYDGHIKLLDFGVAKTLAGRHQTRPGGVKGKMGYIAPEAFRGDALDRRADVYSAGVLLWELLVGRRMWNRNSESAIARHLAMGVPAPPIPRDLALPSELRAICARALATDPAQRYQSAAELEADLEVVDGDTTESSSRHLGRIVAQAFDPERSQRQALIEGHLQRNEVLGEGLDGALNDTSNETFGEALWDYASIEVSNHPPGLAPGLAGRPVARPPRSLAAGLAVGVALVAGIYLGHRAPTWPVIAMAAAHDAMADGSSARVTIPHAVAGAASVAAPPIVVERLGAERIGAEDLDRSGPASRRVGRRGRPHRHARTAGPYWSDDVLDPEGYPATPPVRSRTLRDLDE